jgi:glycosyltransferase involved in cell wall biosynthesis
MAKISVIVPAFNSERYLAETLESILNQSYPPAEVIVVDDGSTDETAAVAKSFAPDVTYIYQDNQGIGGARNKGLSSAGGDYFAFLDSDDIWLQDKLALQMAVFNHDPQVDLVYGHVRQFFTPELKEQIEKKLHIPREVMPAHLSCAMLVRREAFFRVGLYNPYRTVGLDMEWYIQALEKKLNIVMLPDILYLRRIHDRNHGITQRGLQQQRLHILKSEIDRRRRQENE